MCFLLVLSGAGLFPGPALADGLNWPTNQLLPSFSTPAPVLDCIDVSSSTSAEIDLFASLEGIVNRTQPRIACVSSVDSEGKFTWLNLHNLPYTLVSGYSAIIKYQTNVAGLVVTDPTQPDTLNLATTIAGVSNLLICDPSLLSTLTNSPYHLPVSQDLRGRFANKYQIYGYLYTNYWPLCTHRMMSGLYTNLHGELRDYLVAVKAATVWLDPGPANPTDRSTLGLFLKDMPPMSGAYTGWWPDEGNGLNWIAQYGIPVLASDYFRNATVFGGLPRPVNVPEIPPPPPLTNKVYVALIMSDGDNIQYMQHVMKMDWDKTVRGSVPIGWTVSPLALDMDPGMLNHYWNSATTNDCLISGPSGAGYSHIQNWNSANLTALARVSDPYLERSGLRVITVWEQVTTGVARAFATNCPTLFGLTDQSGGNYTTVNLGLRTLGLTVAYSSAVADIISGLTNAAHSFNGSAPMFLAAQAVVWSLGPTDLKTIANALDPNKYVVVRPDHLFMLYNQLYGAPVAVTKSATSIRPNSATLQGFAIGNGPGARAWFEWGTNTGYGTKTALTSLSGNSLTAVSAPLSGLVPTANYHYRVAVSNSLGVVRGADQVFRTAGRLKAWGDNSLGQTNLPAGLGNVVGVGAGTGHGLALENDGSVVAWGDNSYQQTNVPPSLAGVVQVAGGIQHSLALQDSGTVVAWGDNSFGQTNIPAGLANVVEVAAGGYHNLALRANGTLTAWGSNAQGQTNVPAGLSNVVGVAAGRYSSVALKANGSVVCWGNNGFGQTNVPAGLNQVVAVAAGDYHTLALRADGISGFNLAPVCKWVADNLAGADGSAVSAWTDSLNGWRATQGNAGNQPRLYSNVFNGHKSVRFSSISSQYLTVAATNNPLSAAGSFTAIVVFKTTTPGVSATSFYQNTGLLGCEQPNVVPDWALCLSSSQLGLGLGAGANGCGSDLSLYGGSVIDGKPHIAMYVRSGDMVTLFVDGAIVAGQGSLCPAARGDYAFQIGAMTATSLYFNGDMAEIQLYDRALSGAEIASVNEVLAANYAVGAAAGRVVGWGNNSNGQTQAPLGTTNATSIASGASFNLALRNDNSLLGWGINSSGQTDLLPGLTNVTAMAGGAGFGLAIGNQVPWVSNAAFAGYINHDLALTLPGGDPDGNPLNFRVLSLPAVGTLYQYTDSGRGAALSVPNSGVTDPGGRLIFAPATGGQGSPYGTFSFMANDGVYSSGTAQATLNIGLPDAPQFVGLDASEAPGFSLAFSGTSNATYSVWGSTNLSDWSWLGTAAEPTPGRYQFLDATATNWPQRFYRASGP